MLGGLGWLSQSQCRIIGLQMKPIELGERLGRWSSGRGSLHVLLSARLRRLIDEGELPPGEPLPPDRVLASALVVGRSTVVAAYDLLRHEGRIVRRQGSGTRVAGAGPAGLRQTTSAPIFLHLLEPRDGVISLACAAPDTPPPELADAYTRILPRLATTSGDIGYHPAGHPALRCAIAERYTRRGIRTGPDHILVTNGAQQALSLLARAFLTPGDRVLVEAPTYHGALEAFREEAAVLRALPIGLSGLKMAARRHHPALAYVISTFHNPTGSVLSPLTRRTLVETAAAAGIPLIDDEVLSDLGFPGEQTPPALAAYADTVISVGSLSKIVWAGLRIGWVRGPRAADRPARGAARRAQPRRERPRPAGRRQPAAAPRAAVAALRRGAENPPRPSTRTTGPASSRLGRAASARRANLVGTPATRRRDLVRADSSAPPRRGTARKRARRIRAKPELPAHPLPRRAGRPDRGHPPPR
jgi:DNA-binding transcriptional MocR family regulator